MDTFADFLHEEIPADDLDDLLATLSVDEELDDGDCASLRTRNDHADFTEASRGQKMKTSMLW